MRTNKKEKIKNNKKNNKKNFKTLNLILIIVGISTCIFTTVMLIFFYMFQTIPDVLCERFYTVVVGECGVAGAIQVVKTICKHKYSPKDMENENETVDETSGDFDVNIETNDTELSFEGDELDG